MTLAIIEADGEAKSISHREETWMYSSLTAVFLCIFSQAALAQCVDSAPAAHTRQDAELAKKTKTAPMAATGAVRAGGELITTAAAGTHDGPPIAAEVPAAGSAGEEESHRRGGPAMLLAALALMSGIALRRYGANSQ
jgi:hypothetical protein